MATCKNCGHKYSILGAEGLGTGLCNKCFRAKEKAGKPTGTSSDPGQVGTGNLEHDWLRVWNPVAKTSLEMKSLLVQRMADPAGRQETAMEGLATGFFLLVVGLLLGLLCVWLSWTHLFWKLILGMLFLSGAAKFFYGLVSLAGNRLRRTATVKCPRCSTTQKIQVKAVHRICTGCLLPMLTGGSEPSKALSLVRCANCLLEFGYVTGNVVSCPSCGIEIARDSGQITVLTGSSLCPHCGNVVPKGACYCKECTHMIAEENAEKLLESLQCSYIAREHILNKRSSIAKAMHGLLKRASASPEVHLAKARQGLDLLDKCAGNEDSLWDVFSGIVYYSGEEMEAGLARGIGINPESLRSLLKRLGTLYAKALRFLYAKRKKELLASGEKPLLVPGYYLEVDCEFADNWNRALVSIGRSDSTVVAGFPNLQNSILDLDPVESVKPPGKQIGSMEPNLAMFKVQSCERMLEEAIRIEEALDAIQIGKNRSGGIPGTQY